MAGRTEVVNLAPGRIVIHTVGLRELSRALSDFTDREVPRTFAREMKEAGEGISVTARSHAQSFAKTGDFAGSISVSGGRSGIFLRSTDPGAGTIEFANLGAGGIGRASGKDKRRRPWGAPKSLTPARALFPGIEEELPKAEARIAEVIERMAQAVEGRAYSTPD